MQPWALRFVAKHVVFTFTLDSARANPKLLCVSRGADTDSLITFHNDYAPRRTPYQQPPREAGFERTCAIDEFTGEQGQRIGRCWVLAEGHSICDVPLSESEARTMEDE